ncbi:MAG: hypothetical protein RB148_12000 [Armatimonadota bacterium]|nr:hypothetical protein [Armatimonadota bacterium]
MPTAQRGPTTTWLRLKDAAARSGRKLYWLAGRMGMSYERLYAAVNEYPGYAPLTDEQRAELARLTETTVEDIWGEQPTAVVMDDGGA